MSKYISKEIFDAYKPFIPIKLDRKISLFDFWEQICEILGIVGEIEVSKQRSFIKYTYNEKPYIVYRPYSEIIEIGENGSTKNENYFVFIKYALQDILDRKLLKSKRKYKKKEKN